MRATHAAALGAGAAVAGRAALTAAIKAKFDRDVAALNGGDPGPLLRGYHPQAVLVFNEGQHRWSGEHRGRPAIEHFLREFSRAGLKGQVTEVWRSGPPWAMTLVARFDDEARSPDGERLYGNRVVVLVRTRWGRIVRHEDFYEDTKRIEALDARLRAIGVDPLPVAA